jgi:hypothetical protein
MARNDHETVTIQAESVSGSAWEGKREKANNSGSSLFLMIILIVQKGRY